MIFSSTVLFALDGLVALVQTNVPHASHIDTGKLRSDASSSASLFSVVGKNRNRF